MEDKNENIKPVKKRRIRWWIKILMYAFLLFVVVDVALIFYATPLLKKYIKQQVYEKTGGLFSVEFNKISVEIGTRRIAIDDFALIADTAVYNKLIQNNKANAALYNIACRSVELQGIKIYNLLINNILNAKNLSVIDPIVELQKLPTKQQIQTTKRDFVHEDLYPSVSPYISEIQIDAIKLDNGKFLLSLRNKQNSAITHIGYISVVLKNFLLNKKQFIKKDRLFYAEDLKIQISEYRANLNDKIHFVSADTVKISTKASTLKVINVGLQPISESPSFLNKIKHNYVKLKTPFVEINGFNISQLYFSRDIVIDKINIKKPDIKMVKKIKTTKINNQVYEQEKRLNLTSLLNEKLNSIKFNSLKINNARLKYFFKSWDLAPQLDAENFNISCDKFDLNKQAHNDFSKIFYSEGLKFSIDKVKGKSADHVHRFLAKNIYASTQEKLFTANAISIKPCCTAHEHTTVEMYVPKLSLRGTNYNEIVHKNVLRIYSMNIAPSVLNIHLKQVELKDSLTRKKRLHKRRRIVFNNVIVNKLSLANSKFHITKPHTDSTAQNFQGNIALQLRNCMLNNQILANEKSKLLAVEQFDVNLSDYSQDLKDLHHIMEAKSLRISNSDSLIAVSGFRLYKTDLQDRRKWLESAKIYNIDIRKAYMKGIDIYRVMGKKELVVNSIVAQNPSINIYNNIYKKSSLKHEKLRQRDSLKTVRDILRNYFKIVNINTLNMRNANLKISDFDSVNIEEPNIKTKLNLLVHKFKFIDSIGIENKISYSEDIKFSLRNFSSRPFQKKYRLKFKEADFSSKDSVFTAKTLSLSPDSLYENARSTNNFFIFYTPFVQSKSISVEELFDYNIVNLGKLSISKPVISLNKKHFSENAPIKVRQKKKPKIKFKQLIASSVNIKNGIFGIVHHSNGKEEMLTSTTFDMQLDRLNIDSAALENPKEFISNLDFKIDMRNSHFQTFGKNNFFDIKYCHFDNKLKKINAKSFTLKIGENNLNKKIAVKQVDIKTIGLSNFYLGEFVIDKNLIINDLYLGKPDFTVFRYKSPMAKKNTEITKLNWYEKIKPKLNSVNIGNIKSDDIKLRLTTQDGFNLSKKIYDKIDAIISGLLIDSLHQNDGRLLFTNDIALRIRNYNTSISDNLYTLHIGDLGFSTGMKKIFAHSVSINPNFTRFQYANKAGKEFSFNYLHAQKIEAKNLDFPLLISKGSFISNEILLDSLQYHNYKNKKYPLDSVEKPALPLELLWKSKREIDIDTVKICNSYIGHEIMMKNSKQEGFLDFTNVNAQISNLTNIPTKIKKNKYTKLHATANFMNDALLTANFKFAINSDIGEYEYNGDLQHFNMQLLNPFVENTNFVSIKSGMVESFNFDIIANNEYATGSVSMLYNNLKLDLISRKKSDSLKVEKRGLFSMVANSIVRNKNRRLKQSHEVYFERNVYKSVVNYWALSVLSGVRNALGFKSKELKMRLKEEKSFLKSQSSYDKRMERQKKKQVKKTRGGKIKN